MADEPLSAAIAGAARRQVSVRALLLGSGPRFARDAIGPVTAFYLGWKTIGLAVGIAAATAVTVTAFFWERRRARTGLLAAIGLTIALVQALVGLASGSAKWYFAPAVIANTAYGLVSSGRCALAVRSRGSSPARPIRSRRR